MTRALALLLALWSLNSVLAADDYPEVPEIDFDHGWRLCEMPDLGDLKGPNPQKQHIVDHGLIQADNGTWQLWACLRGTGVGRLLYRWQGKELKNAPWKPVGIAARAESTWGESVGEQESIQAPYMIKDKGKYLLFYNSSGIRLMVSDDGVDYERRPKEQGGSLLYANGGRDVMVLKHDGKYLAYSTLSEPGKGFVVLRESTDLVDWTPRKVVCEGGQAGSGPVSAESPFVVYRHGWFYLFRSSSTDFKTYVYRSREHDDFGHGKDEKLIAVFRLKAPEIVRDGDQEYITDLADFQGLKIYPLSWNRDIR